mmetsp:Transcript_12097/g.14205  ORF Transcript_12097/g.14205 Transcript_12097/m.14205 type:complete len:888 (-) Transcript_12097:153-2816(-)
MISTESKICTVLRILLLGACCVNHLELVDGLAYAPNFITKIISRSTGQNPVGLVDIIPTTTNDDATIEARNIAPEESGEAGIDLDRSTTGPITTRFPPEPNGYLHLGHAKAVSFNFAVARMFPPDGRCNMRLDDTNPTKEDKEYVDSILEDVRWVQSGMEPFTNPPLQDSEKQENVGPWGGPVHKTSDYFDEIYNCAVALIKSGDAYVDSLSAEEMKEYRGTLTEPGKDSPYKGRSVDENLDLFEKMKAGIFKDGEHLVRAKIDMASPNLNLRDPALFRIKHASHPATGDKWCIYPMYDFSHPIADAIEGVTHSLCTLEFEDHRPLYDWTLDKLIAMELLVSRPRQIEFSRLNLMYTILSKRKLIQLVEGKHVNGWDDPRMPSLSGLRRRGVPPEALRLFCERVGISKVDSVIDVVELENCVREVMDETSKRAFAILCPLKVTIKNWQGSTIEDFEAPCHPKLEEMGKRAVPFGKHVYIERSDFFDLDGPEGEANGGKIPKGFKRLLPEGMVRLRYTYVIKCDEVLRDPETNEPTELMCTLYPETRAGVTTESIGRVKGIIQWVEAKTGIKCKINQYDRLFKAEEPGKVSGDFLDDLNPDSLEVFKNAIVEPSAAMEALNLLAGIRAQKREGSSLEPLYHSRLAYQFERSGYFALDPSSTGLDNIVFNRVVTLRDTWSRGPKKTKVEDSNKRNRGGDKAQGRGDKKNDSVIEDARRVAVRAATILEANPHPDADSLIVCKVNCSEEEVEPRTVIAGLGGKIPIEDLVGRKVACVTNLKPARVRGIESTAMLLVAFDKNSGGDEKTELLDIPESIANGELLSFEGKEMSDPDAMMKSKGALKAFDRFKGNLKVNENREVVYADEGKQFRLMTRSGPAQVSTLKDASIQ